MPKGPRGEKRPADVIGAAIMVAKIATGEIEDTRRDPGKEYARKGGLRGGKARAAGHRAYLQAVEEAFGDDIDYAMLVKLYGNVTDAEHRYSPAECIGARKTRITGNPDRDHVSTSYVERQNLTMRMSMRRFTRLTNAHSKKLENHHHAQALYFMYYNFVRTNQAVRMSPAMAAGIGTRLWEMADLVRITDEFQARASN